MAYGSNITAIEGYKGGDQSAFYKMGAEDRKRGYHKKVAKAMKGVTGKYKNMGREQLESRLAELKGMKAKLLNTQAEQTKQESQVSGYRPLGAATPNTEAVNAKPMPLFGGR